MTLKELSDIPALKNTPFPFKGKRDFRNFTEDDYYQFAAGVFERIPNPMALDPQESAVARKCKWVGGRDRFSEALNMLLMLGIDCTFEPPHSELVGDSEDTFKVRVPFYTIHWKMEP